MRRAYTTECVADPPAPPIQNLPDSARGDVMTNSCLAMSYSAMVSTPAALLA